MSPTRPTPKNSPNASSSRPRLGRRAGHLPRRPARLVPQPGDDGPGTAGELAARTGTLARYAREWLEQQAVTGVLARRPTTTPTPAVPTARRRGRGAHDERQPRLPRAAGPHVRRRRRADSRSARRRTAPAAASAGRDFGDDAREWQADMNRPWFEQLSPSFADRATDSTPARRPDARVADVGWAPAGRRSRSPQAYPELRVEGFDVDAPSSTWLARTRGRGCGGPGARSASPTATRLEHHGPSTRRSPSSASTTWRSRSPCCGDASGRPDDGAGDHHG